MVEQLTKGDEKTLLSQETVETVKAPNPDATTPPAQTEGKSELSPQQWKTMQSYLAGQIEAKVRPLLSEIATFKTAKQSEVKSQAIEAEAKRWIEDEEVPEGKVRKFSDAVKEYASSVTEHNAKIQEHDTRVQEFETKYGDTINSKYLYDKAFPEASDVIKESLAKMADAKTDRERELLAEKLSVGLREKLIETLTPKEDKEIKRPDSGRTSLGGKTTKNLSPREMITEGLKKAK